MESRQIETSVENAVLDVEGALEKGGRIEQRTIAQGGKCHEGSSIYHPK